MEQSFDIAAVMESVSTVLSAWGLKVIGALAVLVLGRMAAGWARRATVRAMERSGVDATLVGFLSGLVYALLLTFVVIAVLGLFGIPTASFIAVLGAAGLAVGLALQGTLSNFAAGVMLLVFRPFKVGDAVEVEGTVGKVHGVGIFSTLLNTMDNVRVVVPNSAVYGSKIKNYSTNPVRRVDLTVGVSYQDDLQVAAATIARVLASDQRVLSDPEATVAVISLGDSSVDFVVRPWCATSDYWPLYFDLTRRLKEELEGAGCSIPYPQRDVHLFEVATSDD